MKRLCLLFLLLSSATCNNEGGSVTNDSVVPDVLASDQAAELVSVDLYVDSAPDFFAPPDQRSAEVPDLQPQDMGPACEPGEGCFLDPCETNEDCLSGWCVGHMGESVCTVECESECPQGWSCQQLAAAAPDVVWVCVSPHANLCLPCSAGEDCHGAALDDVCVDYGDEGSFCGSTCETDDDCPWGFSCEAGETVEGVPVTQCVADAGVCPCSKRAVELALFTACQVANEFGACAGKRVCTEEGLQDCDAGLPEQETCDGLDNDCDGEIDEPLNVDGDYVNLCDDGNPCTEDGCKGEAGCESVALQEGECMDGNPCTAADHCVDGVCTGDPVECDDGNPCTDDLCKETGGCEYPPVPGDCDDGDPCTLGDHCTDGACAGEPVDCECSTDDDCAALDDGDACNGTLICDTTSLPYLCKVDPETVITCPEPEDDLCKAALCDPQTGACSLAPAHEGLPCNDGSLCTANDTCSGGTCVGGQALPCGDGNPCTDDACDPATGCVHTNNTQACDDGNACTANDTCSGGACVGSQALACGDDDPCTDSTCDPAIGCITTMNQADCNDGDLCTINDHCHLGECIGGGNLTCDDGNPCTDDACAPAVGCTFTANEAACDDGTECTVGDHCQDGMCKPTGFLACDDDDICTDDACDPDSGCVFVDNDTCCGNGQLDEGEECDDGNDNNNDYCDNDCHFSGSVFSQYDYSGRTVYIFKSNSNVALSTYDTFCQSLGLQWWVPKSSQDAQKLLEYCHNLDGGHHTWIIQKNNTSAGHIAGFQVSVNGPSCVSFSNSGFSAVRWQWACAFCDPEEYGYTKCWDSGHTYDWLACEGG